MQIGIDLNHVAKATYWCTRHNCELEPNMLSRTPKQTKEAILRAMGGDLAHYTTDEDAHNAVDNVYKILSRLDYTRWTDSSWASPDYMLGPQCFTCPSVEAECVASGHMHADPDALGKEVHADWDSWIMILPTYEADSAHTTATYPFAPFAEQK